MDGVRKMSESEFCPNCGKLIKPNDEFCPNCGARIAAKKRADRNIVLRKVPKRAQVCLKMSLRQQSIINR